MKKLVFVLSVLVIVLAVCLSSVLLLGFNSSVKKEDVFSSVTDDYTEVIDYPLVEIPFNDGSDWLVAIRSTLGTDSEMLLVSPTSTNLQLCKEELLIITHPVTSEETEPYGYLYVYKDGKIFKEVGFDDIFFEMNQFENQGLRRLFEYITLDEFNYMVEDKLSLGNLSESDVYSKVDYPLVDVLFDAESDWTVILRENLLTENEKFYVCENGEVLEQNKRNLKLATFPAGRGTTPNGVLYIYKNGTLIKEVQYFDSYFETDALKGEFRELSIEKTGELISGDLPPAI